MNKATSDAALLSVALDRTLAETLQSQLVRQLRQLILDRLIPPGAKLPSSRVLAEELSVSRVTVQAAVDQLASEGYILGRHGSGVFVETHLPDYMPDGGPKPESHDSSLAPLSWARPFDVAIPDLLNFPYRDWAKLYDRVWRAPQRPLLANPDPLGWGPLRTAIANHLREWRRVSCDPGQIVITSGIVEAVHLIARTALAEGDMVVVEEPGYEIVRRALTQCRLRCRLSKVDGDGFDIRLAASRFPGARAVVVTPSRQYPLGMVLPLARRLQLLDWAEANNGFVIEDDFDSEYRYQGQPLPALMSLENHGRVIYVGSFSKMLFPGIRLGFVVMPGSLRNAVGRGLSETGPRASLMMQPVLSQFMEDGGFARHIRRMRRLYGKRQKVLIGAVRQHAGDLLDVEPSPAGMHLIATLKPEIARKMSDVEASSRAVKAGVSARALSSFYAGTSTEQGLVLGYAGFDDTAIERGVIALKQALTCPP